MSLKGLNTITEGLKEILDFIKEIGPITTNAIPVITKIIPWIEKAFNSMVKFFESWEKLGDFFKDPVKAAAGVLTLTVPIIGQLAARMMLYNGSIDLPWLMLFSIPPLTIVPLLAMVLGYIKPLKGGAPWDNLVWLPIIGILLGTLIAADNTILNVIKIFLGIGSFYLAYSSKAVHTCKNKDKISKVVLDSLNSYMLVIVLSMILPKLPIVGRFFEMAQVLLPKSELFLQAFTVFIVYVGTNIFNGSIPQLCNVGINDDDLYGILLMAILLTFILSFSPGDAMSMLEGMAKNAAKEMI